ncbi:MAG: amylo-alpha-1,6-glucosidase [Kiritimatiellae bacterium]|nr:amylo-alpha-1,6-glucosidase [Kiritimatiellia bacterium]
MNATIPFLQTGNRTIDKAFRIAMGDFLGNIHPIRKGLLAVEAPVIFAGIHYIEPWIRDASFNVWNGASLIAPEAAKNTLMSIIDESQGIRRVGYHSNHYWDAIISVIGFWQHYLYTGDREFLAQTFEVARNTMQFFEETEYDPQDGLFRGLACCMDCISGYPDELAYPIHDRSDYAGARGCKRLFTGAQAPAKGDGIPFKAMSTNCVYFQAYKVLEQMAKALGQPSDRDWPAKAENLKCAINRNFWIDAKKYYYYIVGCPIGPGTCDHQEGFGHAFAILFDIADAERKKHVFANQYLAPAGLPYVWPNFPRYIKQYGPNEYGRGAGTVWPHVQAFWGDAALRNGRPDLFRRELMLMAQHAERDSHFAEVLHPVTGEIYGGVQEVNYTSKPRQTWCATGFIRLVLRGLLGMEFAPDGIRFHPWLPPEIDHLVFSNLCYRQAILQIRVAGHGGKVERFAVNGVKQSKPWMPAEGAGDITIEIVLT